MINGNSTSPWKSLESENLWPFSCSYCLLNTSWTKNLCDNSKIPNSTFWKKTQSFKLTRFWSLKPKIRAFRWNSGFCGYTGLAPVTTWGSQPTHRFAKNIMLIRRQGLNKVLRKITDHPKKTQKFYDLTFAWIKLCQFFLSGKTHFFQ